MYGYQLAGRWGEVTLALSANTILAFRPHSYREYHSYAGRVVAWSPTTGGKEFDSGESNSILCAALSPDGTLVAVGQADGVVRVEPIRGTGRTIRFRAHDRGVNRVCFAGDGRRLATASWDGHVRIWTMTTPAT